MKYIIDLIEDVREEPGKQEDFVLTAMLLKKHPEDPEKLTYAGESPLNQFYLDDVDRKLIFKIDGSESRITVEELIPSLLILDMDMMMYRLKMDVNADYDDIDVIGFGTSAEEKKYILFIKM